MGDNLESKMQDFMVQKNEKSSKKEGLSSATKENTLPDKKRSMNQETAGRQEDAERHLLLVRIINFLVLLPLGLVLIAGAVVLFIKLVPNVLFIIRQIFVKILFGA